jgi:15-cis-phytoene synthase
MLDIAWDRILLAQAHIDFTQDSYVDLNFQFPGETIKSSYRYCKVLTSIHSKSFFMASALLPKEKRRAIRALYAFCRTTDDIIDTQGCHGESYLQVWRERSIRCIPRANDPVLEAWVETKKKYKIPTSYVQQLLDGVASDVKIHRYQNFQELTVYCYGVASTVGLMSMHIIGFNDESAIRYAVKLGVALQLTNILRDIAEDYKMGRVYLPQDELQQFGITSKHLEDGINDENWQAFMKFQIARVRSIYAEAWPGINLLHPSGRLAIAAAATFYKAILNKIEERNYDVFSGRASLGKWAKIKMIPGIWYQYGLKGKKYN